MDASTWLSKDENLVTRELLFRYRLCYDLALATARRNNPLGILSVDVDRFGWDLAFDDNDTEHRVQLKVVSPDARTEYWYPRKHLFRPERGLAGRLGFEESPEGEGLGGGLILTDWTPASDDFTVTYSYASVLTLTTQAQGIIGDADVQKKAAELITLLQRGPGREQLAIPRKVLLTPASPVGLLALMGLHAGTTERQINVHWNLLWRQPPSEEPASIGRDTLRDDINTALNYLPSSTTT